MQFFFHIRNQNQMCEDFWKYHIHIHTILFHSSKDHNNCTWFFFVSQQRMFCGIGICCIDSLPTFRHLHMLLYTKHTLQKCLILSKPFIHIFPKNLAPGVWYGLVPSNIVISNDYVQAPIRAAVIIKKYFLKGGHY